MEIKQSVLFPEELIINVSRSSLPSIVFNDTHHCSPLSYSSRKALKVLEVGLRSDGLDPAADAEFFGFCMSPFSRTLRFPVAFFLPSVL